MAESDIAAAQGYENANLRKPLGVAEIGREASSLYHIFGADIHKRGNLSLIEDNIVVYACGNSVVFENYDSRTKQYLRGIEDGGVGSVAVHPSRKYLAVGAVGYQPNIYIYEYPSLKVVKVLRGGAERGYASLSFNKSGEKLASVAMAPDFMLTVWDWAEERIGLHAKAFGQDVYSVRFSLDDEHRLTTCGTGHIRFWKMASTFTGLKLQGNIGKFGKVELSDIGAFVELPDGKVISGTESGALLLWEGNFIKCRFVQATGSPCHHGEVTYVEYDRREKCVITAGIDGYVRFWDFDTIDTAEVDSDHSMDFEILPLAEYRLPGGSAEAPRGVRCLVDSGTLSHGQRTWVIQDNRGSLCAVSFSLPSAGGTSAGGSSEQGSLVNYLQSAVPNEAQEYSDVPCWTFNVGHSRPVLSVDTSPRVPWAASCSGDGQVNVWDLDRRVPITGRKFDRSVTVVRFVPVSLDPRGMTLVLGFDDGIVRMFSVTSVGEDQYELSLIMATKPHNSAVTDMRFSPSGRYCATSSRDGNVFLLNCVSLEEDTNRWTPVRFVSLPKATGTTGKSAVYPERLSWGPEDDDYVLCDCSDGKSRELCIKDLTKPLAAKTAPVSVPQDAPTSEGGDGNSAESNPPSAEGTSSETTTEEVVESFEVSVPIKIISTKVLVPSSAPLAATGGTPSAEGTTTEGSSGSQAEATLSPIEVTSAVYSVGRPTRSLLMAGASGNRPLGLFEGTPPSSSSESPSTEVLYGLHSSDGKDGLRCPTIQGIRPTWSRRLLLVSSSDGSVAVLPVRFFEVYHSFVAHGGQGGVREAASSWDDRYVVTAGSDGMVSVQALRLDLVFSSGTENLARDIDAGVYTQQKTKKKGPTPEEEGTVPYLHLTTVCDDSQPLTLPGFPDQTPFLPGTNEEVPPAVPPPTPSVTAVADLSSSSYSIQDAKLKSEEDSKKSSADILKDRVRAQIKSLRKEFSDLCKVNESFPKDVQLTGDRLNVDGDYWDLLLTRSLAQIDEVHKECAYDNEKAMVVHKKVTEAFMQGLVVEEIKLSAFRRDDPYQSTNTRNSEIPFVMSLRTRGLDPSVVEILNEVRSQVRDESLEESQTLANEMAQKKALLTLDEMKDRLSKKDEQAKDGTGNNASGDQNGTGEDGRPSTSPSQMIGASGVPGATGTTNGTGGLRNTSSVVRREMRRQRKSALSSHESEKPREDEDDVRDITAIRVAEKTLGDYKLKSGEDYEISEEQRVNAAKKRQQMALVEDTMVSMRLQFNEKFLQLRDLKRQIVYSVRKDNARIRAIDAELSQPDLSRSLWEPTLDPSEFPDDRDEVTRDELDRFEASKKGSKSGTIESVPPPPANSRITGIKTQVVRNPVSGAYRTDQRPALSLSEMKTEEVRISDRNDQDENSDPSKSQSSSDGSKKAHYEVDDSVLSRYSNPSQLRSRGSSSSSQVSQQRLRSLEEAVPVLRGIRVAKTKRMEISRPTDFVKEICQERRKLLEFERRMLLERIDKSVKAFADAIYELRVERHNLLSDLKLGELRLMTLFREYTLLLTFESRDLALQQKQLRCQGEKTEIANNMKESKAKLDGKMEELKSWQEKMAALLAELSPLLPDNNAALSDQLMKIFKKKIKRNKGGDNDNEDEDDEDDDVDDDDDDEEEVEDVCPPGFDPQAYEKIIDLRDRRLDIDEAVSDIQKAIEDLKKSTDRLKQREKQIVKDAQQTESEVQQFQLQKQAALNQIDVLVPLTFSQVYAFEGSGVFTAPSDRPRPLDIAVEGSELIDQAAKLRDISTRTLCAQIDMNSQVLFNKQALQRLDVRIHELHKECEESNVNFKELHKERVRLKREKQSREEEIEGLLKKCNDLQMLKFGRIMDLDELEAGADRSKEEEAELGLSDIEQQSRLEQIKLIKEIDALKVELTKITTESTEILSQIANLTEAKLRLDRELKESAPGAGQDVVGESTKEREERERIVTYIKLQAKEIESLRAEIAMLKRKDAPPIAIPALPLPPGTQPAEPFLPPIPNNNQQGSKRSLK